MGNFSPEKTFFGEFTPNDGTIEFYGRIKALARPDHVVLDLGAGRAAWFEDDRCGYRREVRALKGYVRELIAADIDEAVLSNRASDRNLVISDQVPLPDGSVDIVIADYVLEHVDDPERFAAEVRRLLKPSGYFCARTPHKFSYVATAARVTSNRKHAQYLDRIQPGRKSEDVFPTAYKLNTVAAIDRYFSGFENASYQFVPDPAYFFGHRALYRLLEWVHRLMPKCFSSNIFVFLRKNCRP